MQRVIFRAFRDGEVIALLPDNPANRGRVLSYLLVGQHAEADTGIVYCTRLATPAEYAPVLAELVSLGYDDLAIRKRLPSWRELERVAWTF